MCSMSAGQQADEGSWEPFYWLVKLRPRKATWHYKVDKLWSGAGRDGGQEYRCKKLTRLGRCAACILTEVWEGECRELQVGMLGRMEQAVEELF